MNVRIDRKLLTKSLRRPAVGLLLGLLLPLAGIGCAAEKPTLTLTCQQKGNVYEQRFAHAYTGRCPRGVDVVLASDLPTSSGDVVGARPAAASSSEAEGLRQIMHIRVLWSPDHAVKLDAPAATNASIRWFVFRGADLVEYAGTGFVSLDPDDETTKVTIRNASLAPVAKQGALQDPIGLARFEGKLVAKNDRKRVDDLLSEMKTTQAAAAMMRAPAEEASAR
jgi:hypothetical protein